MSELLGNEYDNFLSCLHLPALAGLRVNTLKISPNDLLHRSQFILTPVPWCSSGYVVESQGGEEPFSPGMHPYHNAGLYYLQEPSAMAAAEILAPRPGEKVLDLAAAPGGKATHLAALMKNTGLLVANEIHPKRIWDLTENLERCGVTNAIVINETPQRLASHFGPYFDRVLLDAPCSGEGMFRKSNHARGEWKPELVQGCAIRQSDILEQAALMVKPGGHLVYSTCTFSVEENEGVIFRFLSQNPAFELETIQPASSFQSARPDWLGLAAEQRINRAIRIWPHLAQGEGHFIALMVKNESSKNYWETASKKITAASNSLSMSIHTGEAKSILENFFKDNLHFPFDNARLTIQGSYIYHLPEYIPDLDSLKVIHPGWWLGSIRKQHFTPSHSLAMGINSDQAMKILPLNLGDPRISSYFAGDSFADSGENGWVLLTVDGFSIGWAKRVQNVVKNFYPHGLRRFV